MTEAMVVKFGVGGAHTGYLVRPEAGSPTRAGVLVLHAWWGLNDFFKGLAARLAAEGYVVLAPDLYDGKVAATIGEAGRLAETADRGAMQATLLAAAGFLEAQPGAAPASGGIGVVGFSLGAFFATLLATRRPETVAAVVLFYGTGPTDVGRARAAYLGHFAETDEWEPRAGVEAFEAALLKAGRPTTFHTYPGTGHWFFESDRPEAYRPAAAELAWARTLGFLGEWLAVTE